MKRFWVCTFLALSTAVCMGGPLRVALLDFEDETISQSLFDGIDTFFFMTPLSEDQVAASRRVLDAAVEGGVQHIVRLSSRSAGWDEQSEFRAWHREIDDDVRKSDAQQPACQNSSSAIATPGSKH